MNKISMDSKYSSSLDLARLLRFPDVSDHIPKKKVARKIERTRSSGAASQAKGPLHLRVGAVAESVLRSGHPWLFGQSVRAQSRQGEAGELAVVYDRKDRFLAVGLFDPDSEIRLRVLQTGEARPIDEAFWAERLDLALEKRAGLFDDQTTGFRCVNGESDGWPGLVLDRYEQTLVVKLYTTAWFRWLDQVTNALVIRLRPEWVVLRLSRNIQQMAATRAGKQDGQLLLGASLDAPVIFKETGLQFYADVLRGQKTGFFLDQRENRRSVEKLAQERTVLNLFSFSGGFSLYAARGGARSVTEVDISAHALAAAQRNYALNKSDPRVRNCRREQIQADAFDWLASRTAGQFDLVILDPPSLAKREAERSTALAAYKRLGSLGLRQLKPGGILVACSCSAHVSEQDFFGAIHAAAKASGRRVEQIQKQGQPADHPAAIPEARYLKSIYLRVT
jgi:23S rRNA (cytosine1962-C5)-methyltransferase